MDNLIQLLSETVGFPTIISAVIVCLVMLLVKKLKPNVSPKTELVIRLIVSILVRISVILITKGEFSTLIESALSVCGVSLIICAFFNKSDNAKELQELVSALLPDVEKQKIDQIFFAMPESQKSEINFKTEREDSNYLTVNTNEVLDESQSAT